MRYVVEKWHFWIFQGKVATSDRLGVRVRLNWRELIRWISSTYSTWMMVVDRPMICRIRHIKLLKSVNFWQELLKKLKRWTFSEQCKQDGGCTTTIFQACRRITRLHSLDVTSNSKSALFDVFWHHLANPAPHRLSESSNDFGCVCLSACPSVRPSVC